MRFFSTLIGAFYSPETYINIRRGQGYGLGYAFLLTVLSSLAITVALIVLLHQAIFASQDGKPPLFDMVTLQVADQLPVMSWQNHHLQTREARPYTIYISGDLFKQHYNNALITIDTTGATNYKTMPTPMLVTATESIVRTKKETKIQPLENIFGNHTFVLSHGVATDMAMQFTTYVHRHLAFFYLFTGLFCWWGILMVFYVLRLCMLLALGVAGLAISRVLNTPADYATSMRLASVSYTPIALVSLLLMADAGHSTSVLWLLVSGCVMLSAAFFVTRETLAEPM